MADSDRSDSIRTARMDGLSDGVFSIAATLLVLEIALALVLVVPFRAIGRMFST